MIFPFPTEWPQYKYKKIITESLHFLVENKRSELNAFVVMDNHINLIWQPLPGHTLSYTQLSFMKFTALQIKFALAIDNPALLAQCRVNKTDREYPRLTGRAGNMETKATQY
jgi:putative transposase